jgi:Dolichyl-phosphate-mannose-protein mannosyltransferase
MTSPGPASIEARARALPFAALACVQWAISFALARRVPTVGTYDTAYYYVIARNIAQGRGITDTVLWQFLGTPEAVQRPAGGYWEIGWPLVLGSLMRVFGTSQRAAILLCAALSGLLPVLTALVARLAGARPGQAFLAGLLVCLQARLWATDVTPDATLMYQLACLGGTAAFLQSWGREPLLPRLLAVGVALAFPMYVRGDGFVLCAAALVLLLFAEGRPTRASLRRAAAVALGAALLGLPFAMRNLDVFGHVTPEGRTLRLWMTSYDDLYRFLSDPTPALWWRQGLGRLAAVRKDAIVAHLGALVSQAPWPLVVFAAVGGVSLVRSARGKVLPLFVVLSLLVPCLVAPLIASADRFVMNVLPILCVMAAAGILAVRDLAARFAPPRIAGAAVIGAGLWSSAFVFRGPTTVRAFVDGLARYRDTPACLADAPRLAPLALAPGDVVLTCDPWRVAAVLDVATVMCPNDGPAAVAAVVERYRPRYVLVSSSPPLRRLVASGGLRLVATLRDGAWYALPAPVRSADGHVTDAAPSPAE